MSYQDIKELVAESYFSKLDIAYDNGQISKLTQDELYKLSKMSLPVYQGQIILTKYFLPYTTLETKNKLLAESLINNEKEIYTVLVENGADQTYDNFNLIVYILNNPYRSDWIYIVLKDINTREKLKTQPNLITQINVIYNFLQEHEKIPIQWIIYTKDNWTQIKQKVYGVYKTKQEAIDTVLNMVKSQYDMKFFNVEKIKNELNTKYSINEWDEVIENNYYDTLREKDKIPLEFYIKSFHNQENILNFYEEPDIYPIIPFTKYAKSIKIEPYNDGLVLGDLISSGSFGKVYKSKLNGKDIAVKVQEVTPVLEMEDFIQEASLQHYIESPYVVKVFSPMYIKENTVYIMMELMDGRLEFIKKRPKNEVFKIVKMLTEGLHFMHNKGVAHLDIKPYNILVKDGIP